MCVSQLGPQSLSYLQLDFSSLVMALGPEICYTLTCKRISEVMRSINSEVSIKQSLCVLCYLVQPPRLYVAITPPDSCSHETMSTISKHLHCVSPKAYLGQDLVIFIFIWPLGYLDLGKH